MLIDFEFDLGDFGFLKAELECDATWNRRVFDNAPFGFNVSFKVIGVEFKSPNITIDKELILNICNDTHSAVYAAIEEKLSEKIAQEVA